MERGERVLWGKLASISSPDLFTFINLIQRTGTLVFRDQGLTKRIYWERGEIIFASSTDPGESLGAFLVRHGKITPDQNLESGQKVTPAKRQGVILVEIGALTPKGLWWGVKNQTQEIIYSLFTWNDGEFEFWATEKPYEERIRLSSSTTNLVMEGIRRLDEWPRIRELFPSTKIVVEAIPEEKRNTDITFTPSELAIFDLVDGQKTIREIIHVSGTEEFEVLRILMSLSLGGWVKKSVQKETAPTPDQDDSPELLAIIELYNQQFCQVWKALENHMDPSAVGLLFATTLGSSGMEDFPILDDIRWLDRGSLKPETLLANVAEQPLCTRRRLLAEALDGLLSFLLFETARHLEPSEKESLYATIRQAREKE